MRTFLLLIILGSISQSLENYKRRREKIKSLLRKYRNEANIQGMFGITSCFIYIYLICLGDQSYRRSTPLVHNNLLSFEPSWLTPTTTTESTTTANNEGPGDSWYYQDDLGKIQGPFSSKVMLIWENQGYFR